MKKIIVLVLPLLLNSIFSSIAAADWSLGSNFGFRSIDPKSVNDTSNVNELQIKTLNVFGIDFLYKTQFPIGLKYDSDSADKTATVSGVAAERKISSNWVSVLAGYSLYGGEGRSADGVQILLMGEYGLWQSSKLTVVDSANNFSDITGKKADSFGGYLEITKAWEHFVLGAQVGYLQRKIKDFEVSNNAFITDANGSRVEVDLSGPITNIILGFKF